uniref:Uncharacterized protein n=1 Tax=Ditylum brightwellii TaxID=49249 RepID=A0A7S1YM36_9STRA
MITAARRLAPRTVAVGGNRGRSLAKLSTINNGAPDESSKTNNYPTSEDCTEVKNVKACTDHDSVVGGSGGVKQLMTVCALNNHPDYRLKVARETFQNKMKSNSSPPTSPNFTFQKPRKPRKSDGSSSGASAEKRLWEARQKMLEKMAQSPSEIILNKNERKRSSSSFRVLPELRKNDGSSSGAITEKRLREARQRMLEKMASSPQTILPSSKKLVEKKNAHISSAPLSYRVAVPQPRKNDGSSSGAITEKRLQEKRQAMLDKMR